MAQLAHIHSHIVPQTRALRVVGVAILALLVTGAVVLALTLPGEDSSSTRSAPAVVAPDVRFDGGPNEGTRGPASVSALPGNVRFDGGPNEGTRGRASVSALPVNGRFDGGPNEGTRGTR